jgi:hypothetical protein
MNRLCISTLALVLSSGAALAGNSYWDPTCAYVLGPKGTVRTISYAPTIGFDGFTGIAVSKGLIACTHCGQTSYTYDKGVFKSGSHGGGETSSHSVGK